MSGQKLEIICLAAAFFLGCTSFIACLKVTLEVNPPTTLMEFENDLSVIVEPKDHTLCVIYMGDGKCAYIMTPSNFRVQMTVTSYGGSVGYFFDSLGYFNNSVVCENDGEVVTTYDDIHVIEKLVNLQLSDTIRLPVVGTVNRGVFSDIYVNFTFANGTDLSSVYGVDGVKGSSGRVYIDEMASNGYLHLPATEFRDLSLHSVDINITNEYSEDRLQVDLINMEVIEGLSLDVDGVILVNKAVEIEARTTWGSGMQYQWWLNEIEDETQKNKIFKHTFTETNQAKISVNVTNRHGSIVSSKIVEVVNPVNGFNASFSEEKTQEVILQSPGSSSFPMGNLSVELSWDGGSQPAISISVQPLEKTAINNFMPKNIRFVNVRVFSGASEQILRVGAKPGPVGLNISSHFVTVKQPFQVQLTESWGRDFHYTADFGDGKSSSAPVSSLIQDVQLQHIYKIPGEYQIALEITTSSETRSIHENVFVQSPIPSFDLSSTSKYTHPGSLLSITMSYAAVSPPTNASCSIDYGDGTPLEELTWFNITATGIAHQYTEEGSFTTTVSCSNMVSEASDAITVDVLGFSYKDFTFLYNRTVPLNSSDDTYAEVKFSVRLLSLIYPPPWVLFIWDFGDGTPTETEHLTSWNKWHNYTARGNFNITVNISTENTQGDIILPITIGILSVSFSRTVGAVSSDLFSISVEGDVGDEALYHVDFGDGQIKQKYVNPVTPGFVFTASIFYHSDGIFLPTVTVWNSNFVERYVLDKGFEAHWPVEGLLINIKPKAIEQPNAAILSIDVPQDQHIPSNVTCTLNFGDGSDLYVFQPNFISNYTKSHRFTALGRITVYVYCSNAVSNESETFLIDVYNQCYGSVRPFSSVDSPIRKLVSQQLTLTANPDIHCTNMSAEFYWSIDAVVNGSENKVSVIQPNTTVLVLGIRSMKPGLYKITFYTNFRELPSSYSSDSVMVLYEESPLIARIKGGTLKTTGVSWPIILDALTFSKDPDYDPFSQQNENLSFEWTYGVLSTKYDADKLLNGSVDVNTRPCPDCLDVRLKPQGVLVLTPGCLVIGQWHVFTVNVSKLSRSATYTQIVHVIREDPPQIDIRCKVNCFKKVNAGFSFSLETECLDCTQYEMLGAKYTWTLYKKVDNNFLPVPDFENLTSTGTAISTMSIRPNSLVPGDTYSLDLAIEGLSNRSSGSVTWTLVVNYPPYNGTCNISPITGYAALDTFNLSCTGWVDEGASTKRSSFDTGERLWYQFTMVGGVKPSLIYAGESPRAPLVELRPGKEENDYQLTIHTKVFDTNNGMTQFNIIARVLPPLKRNSAVTDKDDVTTVIRKMDTRLEKAIITGDIATVARVTETSASVLNVLDLPGDNSSIPEDPEPWISSEPADIPKGNESAKQWQELWGDLMAPRDSEMKQKLSDTTSKFTKSLSVTLGSINITSTDIIHHVSGSLATIMEKSSRVPEAALEDAGETLDKMGSSLKSVVHEDMSDTHVGTVLDNNSTSTLAPKSGTPNIHAMLNTVAGVVKATVPDMSAPSDLTDVESALSAIAKSRSYTHLEDGEVMRERLDEADLQDEERAFLYVRQSLHKKYEYKRRMKMAKNLVKQLNKSVDNVLDAASTFLVLGQQPLTLQNKYISASVGRNTLRGFLNRSQDAGEINLYTHPYPGDASSQTVEVVLKTTVYHKKPVMLDEKYEDLAGTATTLHLGFAPESEHWREDDNVLPNITVKHRISIPVPERIAFTTTTPKYIPLDRDQLLYHRLELSSVHSDIIIYFRPSILTIEYEVFFRSQDFPTATTFDFKIFTEPVGPGNRTLRAICPGDTLPVAGTVYVGIKSRPLELKRVRSEEVPQDLAVYQPLPPDSANYSEIRAANFDVGVATVDCSAWMEDADEWDSVLCSMSHESDFEKTICACDHPVLAVLNVAQSFMVPVNTIDFSTVFAKIDLQNNSSVFACVVILLALYAILAIWARRKDQADVLKWGITSLIDNYSGDRYLYILTVYTGMRFGAGTRSRVGFAVVGDQGDTGIRLLNDGIREQIPSRSIMHFLLAVPRTLGDLQYMRIWHDNSGQGSMASWFLHKVVVEDLQTDRRYIFNCGRWLAVEKDDGMIERLLPVSAKQDLVTFKGLFYNNTRKNFTDNHLWFSVILRPQRSQFTRLQRLSCCLCLLFLAMLGNAMFYNNGENIVNPTVVNMGIFRFSLQQLYVSLICLIIVTPINILIVWVFKRSKAHWHNLETARDQGCRCCGFPLFWQTSPEQKKLQQALVTRGFHEPKERQLPHFCIYIAWAIIFLCVTLSAFFLFLYSQQWGKAKTEEWLTSFLLSFIESLFIVDPLKVLVVAALFALFIRKPDDGASEGFDKKEIKSGKTATGTPEGGERKTIEPLTGEDLKNAQTARHKETKAYTVLREILFYIIFLFIVYTIGYSNRDNRSFHLHSNMLKTMMTPHGSIGLKEVGTTETFFKWVNETVFPTLFQETYYQGSRRRWWERYYIRDWQNYRVGPPRMRQVRSPQIEMCYKKIMGSIPCNDRYYMYQQEAKDFCVGWKEGPCPEEESAYNLTPQAWKFTSYADALSMPVFGYFNAYSGGGYIADLDVNLDVSTKILDELFAGLWVDRQTRAVIIEFTVFNANTNMFCYVNLMAEFPETGGVLTYNIIRPFRIYQHTGALGAYIFFNEIIFAVVVFVGVIKVILKLRQQGFKYFQDSWHINEFFCLLSCLVGIAIYIVREVISRITMSQFRKNPKRYVSFYHITIWDEVLVDVIGVVSFICTVRMIRILGYSKRSSALMKVLKNASRDLYYFSIMFFLFFAPFAIVAYVIFGHTIADYRDMLVTTATLITCMIGRSPFTEMRQMEPFFAQLYFGSFIFFEVFILLTMFLAILNESITAVRADQNIVYTQHDMLDLLLGKFKETIAIFLPKRLKQAVEEISKKEVEKDSVKDSEPPKKQIDESPERTDSREDILKTAAEVLFMQKMVQSKQKKTGKTTSGQQSPTGDGR